MQLSRGQRMTRVQILWCQRSSRASPSAHHSESVFCVLFCVCLLSGGQVVALFCVRCLQAAHKQITHETYAHIHTKTNTHTTHTHRYETPSGFPPGTAPSTAPQPTQIDPNGAQILRLEPPPPSPEAEASLSIPPALPYQPSAPQSSIGPGPNTPAQGTPGTAPPSSPYQRPPPSADAHARAHTSSRGGQEGRHTPQERDRRGDARKGRGHSIGRHHTSESRRGGYGEAETYGRHSSSHRHSSRQDRGHREERRHHRDRHAHEHVRGERGEEKGGHERREVHGYRGSGWREGGERERGERRRPHHHSEHRRRDDVSLCFLWHPAASLFLPLLAISALHSTVHDRSLKHIRSL